VRGYNPLTIAGIVAALAGAWGVLAASTSTVAFIIGVSIAAELVSLALTVVSWRAVSQHGGDAIAALCVSWVATIPGIVLLANLPGTTNGIDIHVMLGVNLLWLLAGPLLFFVSSVVAPSRSGPRSLSLVRGGHLAAWLSSTFVTTLCVAAFRWEPWEGSQTLPR